MGCALYPYLLQKYNCRINVEICSTMSAIKYLHKYVYKGHDRASIAVESDRDEIQEYLDARYISASESCWRIFDFLLQVRSHSVEKLAIHLPNSAFVTFRPTDPAEDVLERGRKSILTEFSALPKLRVCFNTTLPRYSKTLRMAAEKMASPP